MSNAPSQFFESRFQSDGACETMPLVQVLFSRPTFPPLYCAASILSLAVCLSTIFLDEKGGDRAVVAAARGDWENSAIEPCPLFVQRSRMHTKVSVYTA